MAAGSGWMALPALSTGPSGSTAVHPPPTPWPAEFRVSHLLAPHLRFPQGPLGEGRRSGRIKPGGSSWSVLASPLQGKDSVPTLPSETVPPSEGHGKRTEVERDQMTCAMAT